MTGQFDDTPYGSERDAVFWDFTITLTLSLKGEGIIERGEGIMERLWLG